MAAVNYKRCLRLFEQRGTPAATETVREMFEAREIRPKDIDLGALFAECFGWDNFQACRQRVREFSDVLREAQGAVHSGMFAAISTQFMYQTVLDAYTSEEFVFTKLIPEAKAVTLDGERVPGIRRIGDEAAVRGETDPYTLAGPSLDWIFTAPIKDRGFIVPVTWEAYFMDKTGQLGERVGGLAAEMGVNVEKRAIDAFIDENTTDHRYNWKGTVIATYGDNSGSHTWDNLAASNALVDWSDLDVAEQLASTLQDPYTSEPILMDFRYLVVTRGNFATAQRIMNATTINVTTPGYATTGNPTQADSQNWYRSRYEVVMSRLLASRLATDTDWFLADIPKMLKRMVAEPLTVKVAGADSHDDFHRRIVQQTRVNERSQFQVFEPRAALKNTA